MDGPDGRERTLSPDEGATVCVCVCACVNRNVDSQFGCIAWNAFHSYA